MDPLAPYFNNILMESKLVDLDPKNLKRTWSNRWVGEERIAKRLGKLLLSEDLLEEDFMFKQWVDSGVDLDRLPICMEIQKNQEN